MIKNKFDYINSQIERRIYKEYIKNGIIKRQLV